MQSIHFVVSNAHNKERDTKLTFCRPNLLIFEVCLSARVHVYNLCITVYNPLPLLSICNTEQTWFRMHTIRSRTRNPGQNRADCRYGGTEGELQGELQGELVSCRVSCRVRGWRSLEVGEATLRGWRGWRGLSRGLERLERLLSRLERLLLRLERLL